MQRQNNKPKNSYNLEIKDILPLTQNQKRTFDRYNEDKNLLLHGMAGTGKTFCALYLALNEMLTYKSTKNKIIIVRSAVPTRDVGFLPGSLKEKLKQYETPYKNICTEIFNRGDAYEILKTKDVVSFMSTSFIRGNTFDDTIVIIDEIQNLTFHELDSIITRTGDNTRLIFSGDFRQSDLIRQQERRGLIDFIKVIDKMSCFSKIEFEIADVVRSGLVKEYLIAKHAIFA
jgi:phosphate starvation-inducible protein PhoH